MFVQSQSMIWKVIHFTNWKVAMKCRTLCLCQFILWAKELVHGKTSLLNLWIEISAVFFFRGKKSLRRSWLLFLLLQLSGSRYRIYFQKYFNMHEVPTSFIIEKMCVLLAKKNKGKSWLQLQWNDAPREIKGGKISWLARCEVEDSVWYRLAARMLIEFGIMYGCTPPPTYLFHVSMWGSKWMLSAVAVNRYTCQST